MIGLAMHNYVSVNNAFPAPAIMGKDGKPALSWRVAILPFLEQQPLYDKFHLDEPWDSPHNKELIKEMPQVFVCPSRSDVAPGTTTYRVFTGPGALFEAGQQKGLQIVTDGTSNTILAVEAKEAVPWTKPDSDLPFDPNAAASLYGAGSPHPWRLQMLLGRRLGARRRRYDRPDRVPDADHLQWRRDRRSGPDPTAPRPGSSPGGKAARCTSIPT